MGKFNHNYWVFIYDTMHIKDKDFYHIYDYPLIWWIFRKYNKEYDKKDILVIIRS